MSAKQIQQIYQYIQTNGNFLSSQKVLRQVDKHPQIIWQLIVKLIYKLKNKNIENAYAQIVFLINEPEKHERSAKWVKQFMDISDLAKKVNSTYTVLDYFKPQKDKIINLIHKFVEVSKGVTKIKQEMDSLIVKDQIMTKEKNKWRLQEQTTKQQLQELKERKQKEKPLYDQIVSNCDRINSEINIKRQQKLELLSKQKTIQDEINNWEKISEDLRYEDETKQLKIEQLKKEVTKNAPEVKKQKRAIEQEFQKLQQQVFDEIEVSRVRQEKIFQIIEDNRIQKDEIIDLVNKLVDKFNQLDQQKLRFGRSKEENQSLQKRKIQVSIHERQIMEIRNELEMQLANQKIVSDSYKIQSKQNEAAYCSVMSKQAEVKERIRLIKERLIKFREFNQSIRQNLERIKSKHDEKYAELSSKRKKWQQHVMNTLQQIYKPLQQINFH